MNSKSMARFAGALYLINRATGLFGIVYVPEGSIASGNAAATARHILVQKQ